MIEQVTLHVWSLVNGDSSENEYGNKVASPFLSALTPKNGDAQGGEKDVM